MHQTDDRSVELLAEITSAPVPPKLNEADETVADELANPTLTTNSGLLPVTFMAGDVKPVAVALPVTVVPPYDTAPGDEPTPLKAAV